MKKLLLAIAVVFVLVACGGGGSDDGDSTYDVSLEEDFAPFAPLNTNACNEGDPRGISPELDELLDAADGYIAYLCAGLPISDINNYESALGANGFDIVPNLGPSEYGMIKDVKDPFVLTWMALVDGSDTYLAWLVIDGDKM